MSLKKLQPLVLFARATAETSSQSELLLTTSSLQIQQLHVVVRYLSPGRRRRCQRSKCRWIRRRRTCRRRPSLCRSAARRRSQTTDGRESTYSNKARVWVWVEDCVCRVLLSHPHLTCASQTSSCRAKRRRAVWLTAGAVHKLRAAAHNEVLSVWLAHVPALFLPWFVTAAVDRKRNVPDGCLSPALCVYQKMVSLGPYPLRSRRPGSRCRRRRRLAAGRGAAGRSGNTALQWSPAGCCDTAATCSVGENRNCTTFQGLAMNKWQNFYRLGGALDGNSVRTNLRWKGVYVKLMRINQRWIMKNRNANVRVANGEGFKARYGYRTVTLHSVSFFWELKFELFFLCLCTAIIQYQLLLKWGRAR